MFGSRDDSPVNDPDMATGSLGEFQVVRGHDDGVAAGVGGDTDLLVRPGKLDGSDHLLQHRQDPGGLAVGQREDAVVQLTGDLHTVELLDEVADLLHLLLDGHDDHGVRAGQGRDGDLVLGMAGALALAVQRGQRLGDPRVGGLGEREDEVVAVLRDMRGAGCQALTLGQYLAPSRGAAAVVRYVRPEKFRKYEGIGLKYGIKHMLCGPLVRSSYMADKVIL